LDDRVKERLRVRAARNGRSMEEEMRRILADAVADSEPSPGLFVTLLDRFEKLGSVELEISERNHQPRAAELSS